MPFMKGHQSNKGKNNPMYGKHLSKEHKRKLSISLKGKSFSKEHNRKISETKKRLYKEGKLKAGMKGKHHTEEAKKKISERMKGENHPNFRNWASRRGYGKDFEEIKPSILKRDNYECCCCLSDGRLNVHHINNIKKDNDPKNLITLCTSCHGFIEKEITKNKF